MAKYRRIVDEYGQVWEVICAPYADEWPAGDPCPNDRESLCYIKKVEINRG